MNMRLFQTTWILFVPFQLSFRGRNLYVEKGGHEQQFWDCLSNTNSNSNSWKTPLAISIAIAIVGKSPQQQQYQQQQCRKWQQQQQFQYYCSCLLLILLMMSITAQHEHSTLISDVENHIISHFCTIDKLQNPKRLTYILRD